MLIAILCVTILNCLVLFALWRIAEHECTAERIRADRYFRLYNSLDCLDEEAA